MCKSSLEPELETRSHLSQANNSYTPIRSIAFSGSKYNYCRTNRSASASKLRRISMPKKAWSPGAISECWKKYLCGRRVRLKKQKLNRINPTNKTKHPQQQSKNPHPLPPKTKAHKKPPTEWRQLTTTFCPNHTKSRCVFVWPWLALWPIYYKSCLTKLLSLPPYTQRSEIPNSLGDPYDMSTWTLCCVLGLPWHCGEDGKEKLKKQSG